MATREVSTPQSATIQVFVRFRPQNVLEKSLNGQIAVEFVENQTVRVKPECAEGGRDQSFSFDHVFDIGIDQAKVYERTARPLIDSVIQGYSCTYFVYGQTGSGKTYSMAGVPGDPKYEGIIPRVMTDIFEGICLAPEEEEFIIKVSYIEIYMEKIRDLIQPAKTNLRIREDKNRGIYVEGATEVPVANPEEMAEVMRKGGANRAISSTRMNLDSSRSHSVFIITVDGRDTVTGSVKAGKLFLVDLAGSEKIGKTKASGQTLEEAKHINKSLTALGNVMMALTSERKGVHVPYRDSKLTRLLQVNAVKTVAEYIAIISEKDKTLEALLDRIKKLQAGQNKGHDEAESNQEEAPLSKSQEPSNSTVQTLESEVESLKEILAEKQTELELLNNNFGSLRNESKTQHEKLETLSSHNSTLEVELQSLRKAVDYLQRENELATQEVSQLKNMLSDGAGKGTGRKSSIEIEGEVDETMQQDAGTSEPNEKDTLLRTIAGLEGERDCLREQVALQKSRIEELQEEVVKAQTSRNETAAALQERVRELETKLSDYEEFVDDVVGVESITRESLASPRMGSFAASRASMGHRGSFTGPKGGGGRALKLVRGGSDFRKKNRKLHSSQSVNEEDTCSKDGKASEWVLDNEVEPLPPVGIDSPVIQELLNKLPGEKKEAVTKWLNFILGGQDIRNKLEPELSLPELSPEMLLGFKKLVIPLIRNRRDLAVHAYTRHRPIVALDLKLTVETRLSSPSRGTDVSVGAIESAEDDIDSAALEQSLSYGSDHPFFGVGSDPTKPSVLHTVRRIDANKPRYVSLPADVRSGASPSAVPDRLGSSLIGPADFARKKGGWGGWKSMVGSAVGAVSNAAKRSLAAQHVHDNTFCDGCGMSPIVGHRWTCSLCADYELCDKCYEKGVHGLENSNEMYQKVKEELLHSCPPLGAVSDLLDLVRERVCRRRLQKFKALTKWLADVVNGKPISKLAARGIAIPRMEATVREEFVTRIMPIMTCRTDVNINTQWFTQTETSEDGSEVIRTETLRLWVSDQNHPHSPFEPRPSPQTRGSERRSSVIQRRSLLGSLGSSSTSLSSQEDPESKVVQRLPLGPDLSPNALPRPDLPSSRSVSRSGSRHNSPRGNHSSSFQAEAVAAALAGQRAAQEAYIRQHSSGSLSSERLPIGGEEVRVAESLNSCRVRQEEKGPD